MKTIWAAAAICAMAVCQAASAAPSDLRVSDNGRFIVKTAGGESFYWTCDTAWGIFYYVSQKDVGIYLADRKNKGFNGFLACIAFHSGNPANIYGQKAWHDDNPLTPNEQFFLDVDKTINKAVKMGFYVGLLPAWGDKVVELEILNSTNAYQYGRFLGNRYKKQNSNIIWVLGGDREPKNDEHKRVFAKLAEGITDGVNGVDKEDGAAEYIATMMTYHPGNFHTSAEWFHNEQWLDFHMIQSGHLKRNNDACYKFIESTYQTQPPKPVMEGEPCYEDHGVGWNLIENGYFNDQDVRRAVYWSVFAGGCGNVYGAHAVWQFASSKFMDSEFLSSTRGYWNEEKDGLSKAKDLPAASDMVHLKNLMLSRPFVSRIPDQTLLADEGEGGWHFQATRDADGSYAFIYFTVADNTRLIKADKLSGERINAWWYNPRDGKVYDGDGKPTSSPFLVFDRQPREFNPPGVSFSEDWVLVLDDASRHYPPPGVKMRR